MLGIRLLGEMEIMRRGERLELPPSRKTRGLLAYLALASRPLRRDRLCALLWDAPDDPKGALRWSLSKLRSLVNDPDQVCREPFPGGEIRELTILEPAEPGA